LGQEGDPLKAAIEELPGLALGGMQVAPRVMAINDNYNPVLADLVELVVVADVVVVGLVVGLEAADDLGGEVVHHHRVREEETRGDLLVEVPDLRRVSAGFPGKPGADDRGRVEVEVAGRRAG
jgi:hypothetical protein